MHSDYPPISETEMEILHCLWSGGPATVREVMERLSGASDRWAYTTVQTLLGRLRDKGIVTRDERSLAHVFEPAVSREQLLDVRLGQLADTICDGERSPLVMRLVAKGRLTADELETLRELIDRTPPRGRGAAGRKKRRSKGRKS